MDPVTIELSGEPEGKGRPRFSRGGQTYTPAGTRKYEAALKHAAGAAMAGRAPFDGPVTVEVDAVVAIPRSWSKRKQQNAAVGLVRPVSRPDVDNYLKIACDGLNAIVFRDDSQIVRAVAAKRYGDRPHLRIVVSPIGEAP